ncbi:MAG: hypothetical protein PHC46_04310 [Clostridia bacterium]|nr:hypothetical protein [Clostridia bacterium]
MKVTGYELSRAWFDFSFENREKIKPIHAALYMFCIELCNRLGWKEKFGLPTTMAMEAIGINSYNTYIKTLNDLIEFGFIKMVTVSKNQYSSNIIALSNFDKALDKALDKASIKHVTKQGESTVQSNSSIIKQINIEQINIEQINQLKKVIRDYESKNGFDLSFIDTQFLPIIQQWLEYKSDKGEKYKSQSSINTLYKHLLKYSNYNPTTAEKIVELSMANNWSGIFELKTNNQQSTPTSMKLLHNKIS